MPHDNLNTCQLKFQLRNLRSTVCSVDVCRKLWVVLDLALGVIFWYSSEVAQKTNCLHSSTCQLHTQLSARAASSDLVKRAADLLLYGNVCNAVIEEQICKRICTGRPVRTSSPWPLSQCTLAHTISTQEYEMMLSHKVVRTGRPNARVAECKTADPSCVLAHVNSRTARPPMPPCRKAERKRLPSPGRSASTRLSTEPATGNATATVVHRSAQPHSAPVPHVTQTAVRSSHRTVKSKHSGRVDSYPIAPSDVSDGEAEGCKMLLSRHSRTLTAAQRAVRDTCSPNERQQRGCSAAAVLPCRQLSQPAAAAVVAASPDMTPTSALKAASRAAPSPELTAVPGHSSGRSLRLALLILLLLCMSAAALLIAATSSSSSSSSSLLYKLSQSINRGSNVSKASAQWIDIPLLASWLDNHGHTSPQAGIHMSAAARTRLAGSASSSKRHLISPPAALPAARKAQSMFRLNSGVVSRVHVADPTTLSMHTGSGGSSSSSSGDYCSGQAQPPAAAARDPVAAAAAESTASESTVLGTPDQAAAAAAAGAIQMIAVVSDSAVSPYKGAAWGDVIRHMAKRLYWTDQRFVLNVITQQQLQNDVEARANLSETLSSSSSSRAGPMFVGIAISDPVIRDYLKSVTANLSTVLFWDSGNDLDHSSRVDGFAPTTASPVDHFLANFIGPSSAARSARAINIISSLWARNTSDDLLFIWLVLLNEYVTPVSLVADTTKGMDLESLWCMISNCGGKIMECVTDATCKKGLDCLQGCAFNDQVCQYRCIVSYETPKFEQFSLCVLQLHNCRGLHAKMPTTPNPQPMSSWRGQPLTQEVAESLFIGWKEAGLQMPDGAVTKRYSWLIAGGKNAAYDHFPCQYQLYSYGKGKGQMWYEPVFKVITLEGHEVWRRRRYRVRRGATPGTFHYSALDNGVTSNEYWRILDCAEDLTYCLFYYSGAASVAGLSYSGAVLGTVDGVWPTSYTERIHDSLRAAGIEPWELNTADNSRCADAPF